jgi:serine/threonine protein phosphatase PrpC
LYIVHVILTLSRSRSRSRSFPTTTITTTTTQQGNRLIVANAGDQRAVLCRGGRPYQITRDHRPDVPDEKARIEQEGGFVSENKRVNGVLALSRALGDPELHPHVTHVPDIFHIELTPEDKFLIIACDGVYVGQERKMWV